jgi:ectoine hydroxylase-related dioxygenase (phytanoyl-CoA dioxygenase family)
MTAPSADTSATAMITPEMVARFQAQGYLVVEGLFDVERDLAPVVTDYAATLDALVDEWLAAGLLQHRYADLPFGQRLIRILSESGVNWSQPFDISLPQTQVYPDTPIHTSEAVFNLLRHPRLLDVVEQFIGPELYSNPIQHTRIKPPERLVPPSARNGNVVRVGWHQDQGVALPEQDEVSVLTVWLPITDATVQNGCLAVVPGSHRRELAAHCPGTGPDGGLQIPSKLIQGQPVPVPVRHGGALLMHSRTMHAALVNQSDDIRWSFDLRYQPVGLPTGRPAFPGFVARSRRDPRSEQRDWRAWSESWLEARARLAQGAPPRFNRWSSDSPACA